MNSLKIKVDDGYYLSRRDNNGMEMFLIRALVFHENNSKDKIAVCLENSIMGVGHTNEDAIQSLIASIEIDLYYRANVADKKMQVIQAEDKYQRLFIALLKKHKRQPRINPSFDFNFIASNCKALFTKDIDKAATAYLQMPFSVCA